MKCAGNLALIEVCHVITPVCSLSIAHQPKLLKMNSACMDSHPLSADIVLLRLSVTLRQSYSEHGFIAVLHQSYQLNECAPIPPSLSNSQTDYNFNLITDSQRSLTGNNAVYSTLLTSTSYNRQGKYFLYSNSIFRRYKSEWFSLLIMMHM